MTSPMLLITAPLAPFAPAGLEPATLFCALAGAAVGLSFAEPTTRARAVGMFFASAMVCSLLGTWLAQRWYEGEPLSRNTFACVLAVLFHPLLNAAVSRVPKALDGIMRKLGIGENP